MAKKVRTLAMRVLDSHKIPYEVHLFPDSISDAVEVADALSQPAELVFKTLVLMREDKNNGTPLLFMLPSNCEVDLRLFAAAIGTKAVKMATHDAAEKLTGLKVGGISALALLHSRFDMYIDESVTAFEEILISGGQRGVDIQLKVSDLLELTAAKIVQGTRMNEQTMNRGGRDAMGLLFHEQCIAPG